MKRDALLTGVVCLLSAIGTSAFAASQLIADAVVAERGPHHAIWQRVSEHTTSLERKYYVTNSYVELATSKHYRNEQGEWSESKSLIELFGDGAVARHGPMQVIFPANARTAGGVDVSVDGKRFRSHVIGIAYAEADTGRAVLVAELQDSIAQLVGNNEIWYPDALAGEVRADIQYVYNIYGLEQNIVIRESIDPAAYGLNPATVRVQVLTEWVEAPEPIKQTVILKQTTDPVRRAAMVDPDLIEERLQFGSVIMPTGAAFPLDEEAEPVLTGKTWETREGNRRVLVEQTEFSEIKAHLDRLPQAAAARTKPTELMARVQPAASGRKGQISLPPAPPRQARVQGQVQPRQMAAIKERGKGFVLDYQLLNANTNNFTFQSGVTYFVSSQVILTGTTTLEPCVIKSTNANSTSRRIWLQGPLNCRTSAYRPAIWTGKNDDTVGEVVAGSTGNPTTNYFGIFLDLNSNTNLINLHHVRMRHAYYGIWTSSSSTYDLSHAQIGFSYAAIVGKAQLRNVLIHDGEYAIGSSATGSRGENVTFHRMEYLRSSGTTLLTNCLIIAVTNNLFYTGTNNATNSSDAGVFQSAGWGARYLVDNSPYRDSGTTNINPELLADLKQRTTFPPFVISNYNSTLAIDTTLPPQAQRDTDLPDLGYHYLPIDWIVGGLTVTGATMRVTGGATVAVDAAKTNWGIRLESGGQLLSEGTPTNLNRFVRTHSVQEIPGGSGTNMAPLFADTYPAPIPGASIRMRFTDIAQIQNHFAFRQENNQGTFATLLFHDSQFRGGTNYLSPNSTNQFIALTNVLVEDSSWRFYPYPATTLRIANCTFKGGWLGLHNAVLGSDWRVHNNVFAYTEFAQSGSATVTNDNNGYLTNAARLTPNGANDIVLATNTVNFQTGPLGSYYLPSGSAFIDAGSVTNAGFVGLWHYTTLTDQTKDAGTRLDLGFHYVAVTNGVPVNSDTDGLADYLEDANGNGTKDDTESDWNVADTDGDGVDDYIEYLQGRNPLAHGASLDTNGVIRLRVYTPLAPVP